MPAHRGAARGSARETTAAGDPVQGIAAVYGWCMACTNIDIDEAACRAVTLQHRLSRRETVNFALRTLEAEALDVEAARALRGSGWDGDLERLRQARSG